MRPRPVRAALQAAMAPYPVVQLEDRSEFEQEQRSQLRRMVRLESVVISVYGAVLGLALRTVFGTASPRALSSRGIQVLVVPTGRLLALLASRRGSACSPSGRPDARPGCRC